MLELLLEQTSVGSQGTTGTLGHGSDSWGRAFDVARPFWMIDDDEDLDDDELFDDEDEDEDDDDEDDLLDDDEEDDDLFDDDEDEDDIGDDDL